MQLFEAKTLMMRSGYTGYWKIECDVLTKGDIDTLAIVVSEKFSFYAVYGVPTDAIRQNKTGGMDIPNISTMG